MLDISQTLVLTIHGGNSTGARTDDGVTVRELVKNQFCTATGQPVWSENLDKFLPGFVSINPVFPNASDAVYEEWKRFFEQVLTTSKYAEYKDVVLVGHSLGTAFLQRYLAENEIQKLGKTLKQLHLVGICLKEGDFKSSENWSNITNQIQSENIWIYHSKDDAVCEFSGAQFMAKNLPGSHFEIFENQGHFTGPELPELVERVFGEVKLA